MSRARKWDSLWQGILSSRKLKAHWEWDRDGRKGQGRIVMTDENLQGAAVRALEGARFERCDFSGSNFYYGQLQEIELVDCTFDEALLRSTNFTRARITGGRIHGGWCGLANFEDATIEGGDWLGSYLERVDWTRSHIRDVSFRAATLVDARFDQATFVDCEFRFADLSHRELDMDLARCPGTRFERCDFRGANLDGLRLNNTVFDRCRFLGVRGRPKLEGPCTLIDPDFSPRDDGADPELRDPAEVLRRWRDDDVRTLNEWASRSKDRRAPSS
jgi:uncharacterized protein YjbI with pentapeptide repeats